MERCVPTVKAPCWPAPGAPRASTATATSRPSTWAGACWRWGPRRHGAHPVTLAPRPGKRGVLLQSCGQAGPPRSSPSLPGRPRTALGTPGRRCRKRRMGRTPSLMGGRGGLLRGPFWVGRGRPLCLSLPPCLPARRVGAATLPALHPPPRPKCQPRPDTGRAWSHRARSTCECRMHGETPVNTDRDVAAARMHPQTGNHTCFSCSFAFWSAGHMGYGWAMDGRIAQTEGRLI